MWRGIGVGGGDSDTVLNGLRQGEDTKSRYVSRFELIIKDSPWAEAEKERTTG